MHDADAEARAAARRFRRRLAALVAAGVAVQALYLVVWRWGLVFYDGPGYSNEANNLADGLGLVKAESLYFDGILRQSAGHPPLHALYLSLGSVLGFRDVPAHQLMQLLPGGLVVAAIGLLGRRVGGDRAGLLAAGIAVVHPGVWSFPATLMTETTAQLFVALFLWGAYSWWRSPRPLVLAATAGAGALASLARSENLLLLALVVGLFVLRRPGLAPRARAVAFGAAVAWAGVLLVPWMAWNQARIGPGVLYANAFDVALVSANCDEVYDSIARGYWLPTCRPDLDVPGPDGRPPSESDVSIAFREQGLAWVRENPGKTSVLAAWRVARTLGIGDLVSLADFESRAEGREPGVLLAAMLATWATAIAAVSGARVLRSRGVLVWPLLAPIAVAALGAAMTHGTSRYRVGIDVGLIVLAAVALDARWPARTAPDEAAA